MFIQFFFVDIFSVRKPWNMSNWGLVADNLFHKIEDAFWSPIPAVLDSLRDPKRSTVIEFNPFKVRQYKQYGK